jgi:hypothetical protein
MVISDPETTRSGAALRVGVGASAEPIPGLVFLISYDFLGSLFRTYAFFGF